MSDVSLTHYGQIKVFSQHRSKQDTCPQPETSNRLTAEAAGENQMSEAASTPVHQPDRLMEGHRSAAELPQFSA